MLLERPTICPGGQTADGDEHYSAYSGAEDEQDNITHDDTDEGERVSEAGSEDGIDSTCSYSQEFEPEDCDWHSPEVRRAMSIGVVSVWNRPELCTPLQFHDAPQLTQPIRCNWKMHWPSFEGNCNVCD